jgi:hypothetical protein
MKVYSIRRPHLRPHDKDKQNERDNVLKKFHPRLKATEPEDSRERLRWRREFALRARRRPEIGLTALSVNGGELRLDDWGMA